MNYAESVLAGDVAWIELLASVGFPSHRLTGGLAVITGIPSNTDNGLVVDPALVDRHELEGAVGWLRASGVPASCILSERPEPDLVADLERLGLTADNDANAMGRSLLHYEPPASTVNGYDVAEVLTIQDLREGLAALGDEWYDERARRLRERVDAALGFGTESRVRHWVGAGERSRRCDGNGVSFRRCGGPRKLWRSASSPTPRCGPSSDGRTTDGGDHRWCDDRGAVALPRRLSPASPARIRVGARGSGPLFPHSHGARSRLANRTRSSPRLNSA
jgi:hypothetical protein